MDGFTDTLAQRFETPQEMITANGQAEAMEIQNLQEQAKKDAESMKTLQEQVDKYEGVLDKFNESVASLDKKINEIQPIEGSSAIDTEEYTSKLSGVEGKLQEHIHKENVRVYRNVQAAVIDELSKQTAALTSKMDELAASISRLDTSLTEKMEDDSKALEEGFAKLGEDSIASAKKATKSKAVLPLQIIMFIVVVADLAMNVLKFLGII